MNTIWEVHKEKWKDCKLCNLCNTRKNVVLARGSIPCDIVFIGEAPGFSEDVIGQPFVGPAGHLLDRIIEEANPGNKWDMAFTNLIACIPKENLNQKVTEPPEESIIACHERLKEFIKLCEPQLIVCVGKVADRRILANFGHSDAKNFLTIIHPASILRMNISQKELAIQRVVVKISDALDELVPF